MFHFCSLARALGDENRARILMALHRAPLCVCQITALLDLAPSTTSKHLSILRQCRLIESCKQGRWVYYQLPKKPAAPSIAAALDWLRLGLESTDTIIDDAARIDQLLRAEQELRQQESAACCHSLEAHMLDAAFNPQAQGEQS